MVRFYQRYISPLKPASCRYYPTCSRYAAEQLQFNSIPAALVWTLLRILRCNQLFDGGIDYPKIPRKRVPKPRALCLAPSSKTKVAVWFVPCKGGRYCVIKALGNA
jgi:putative membrane protein insertion efficiency factor